MPEQPDAPAEERHPSMPPEATAYVAEALRRGAEVTDPAIRQWRDIMYGPSPHQLMDVFASTDLANRPLPVLVYIHGGGWTHGAKEWMTFMAPALTRYPAILVVPSYGLAPAHTHPEPVVDCLRALVCTRQKAADFGGDPDRLFVGGHSVGGHISAMIALRPDLCADHGFPHEAIRACFPVSGLFCVYDTDPTAPADMREASPMHWIDHASVPFYVGYGEKDYGRIIEENVAFVERLGATGVHLESETLGGLDHYGANLCNGDIDSSWSRRVRAWMAANGAPGE